MAKTVLIDSGVIFAALYRRDQHHAWAKSHFEAFTAPLLSCEAVFSETFFLLDRVGVSVDLLCEILDRRIITTGFALEEHLAEATGLMRRYRDMPMSLADACLVRMAELYNDSVLFTTNRDFETYRKNGRQMIPLIRPW
jgi:predicted nucleic acid-binding protein